MLEHAGKSQDGGENTNTAEDDYNNHMDDHGDGWFHDDDDVDVDDLLVDKENESLGNTGITANNYIPTEATEEMISKNDQKDMPQQRRKYDCMRSSPLKIPNGLMNMGG